MKKAGPVEYAVFLLNTVGFAGYLAWLIFSPQRIFYTQEGVIYLLPCLPFFFVYAYLLRKHVDDTDEKDTED